MSEIKYKDTSKIELRSEEFQEVLGAVPPWILRWGITMVAIIVVLLLIGSMIFKYPDTVSASITLTGTTPVAGIVAKTSGKLQHLYIQDNQSVTKGDYLAVIDNSANVEDILLLKKYLTNLDTSDNLTTISPSQLQLGSFQSLYTNFFLSLSEYIQFVDLNYHLKKIEYVKDRIRQNEKQYTNILRQKGLIDEQYKIAETQHERDKVLTSKGVFSKEELENSYNQFLQSKLALENINTSLENLRIQIEQLNESLYDTQYQYIDKKNTLENQLTSQKSQLMNEIESWELTYALMSPITGKITFTEYWSENQNINSGDVVFNIVPSEEGSLMGKALLPLQRSGKVKVGQKVNIRFSSFPDNEFGIVKGTVKNISLVPSKGKEMSQYVIGVSLPNGLETTYKKTIPFLPEMEGQADIITDDLSVLERFLLPLRKVLTEGLR